MFKIAMIFVGLVFLGGTATPVQPNAAEDPVAQTSFPDIVSSIKNGIAYVNVSTSIPSIASKGTAFLIDKSGVLATCSHIFFDTLKYGRSVGIPDTSHILVRFHYHQNFYKAAVVASREDRDIALLQVSFRPGEVDSLNVVPVQLGSTEETREGVDLACAGYDLDQRTRPFGRTYHWLTTHRGILSCAEWIGPEGDQEFLNSFQADMLVNRGASGSPVYLAESGRVIGMIKGFQGQDTCGVTINYGLADCVPIWAIVRLLLQWQTPVAAPDTAAAK